MAAPAPEQPLEQALSRVSEEAEVFRLTAPKILAREKLVQRTRKPPRRFRPRLGNDALEPPKPQYRTREIISEYAFSTLAEAPGALHEFRQVISVDNRPVLTPENARRTLSSGLRSDDDRAKKRMLESFEKYGLRGAAADFGQVLLLFTRPRLQDYSFTPAGSGQVGADPARIWAFKQIRGAASLLILEKRKAIHQPLEGELWVRESDGLPLRIVLVSEHDEGGAAIRDESRVDYAMTPRGYLAPASVVHRQTSGGVLVVEDVYKYSAFRMFQADSDITFPEQSHP
jgi:hypothetical protein